MEWLILTGVIIAWNIYRSRRNGGQSRANARARAEAFAYAMLRLGARVAKADGRITPEEVLAFKRAFPVENIVPNAGEVFREASNDTRPVEHVAEEARIAIGANNRQMFVMVMMGLARVVVADGHLSEAELDILVRIGGVFGFPPGMVVAMVQAAGGTARGAWEGHQAGRPANARAQALDLMGLEEGASQAEIKSAWRRLAKENHPDIIRAKGAPPSAVKDAETYMKAINEAYDQLKSA